MVYLNFQQFRYILVNLDISRAAHLFKHYVQLKERPKEGLASFFSSRIDFRNRTKGGGGAKIHLARLHWVEKRGRVLWSQKYNLGVCMDDYTNS